MAESGGAGSIVTYPVGSTPVTASSGQVANAAAVATMPAVAGRLNWCTGFVITAGNATAAAAVAAILAGILGGTLTFIYAVNAAAGDVPAALAVSFPTPIRGSAANTAIVLTLPALGAGNAAAAVSIFGYVL